MSVKKTAGFTLLEILIAVFIFSIVSMIMTGALHNVINTQSAAEKKSTRFAEIQMAMLVLSRDIEQTIDRPIFRSANLQEGFIGSRKTIIFTHAGLSNPFGQLTRATLQRTRYQLENNNLIRITWPALDRTDKTQPETRVLLSHVSNLHFDYVDHEGHVQPVWPPLENKQNIPTPRAVRVTLTIDDAGTIAQLYLVPGQPIEKQPQQ